MKQLHHLYRHILCAEDYSVDRTGVGTFKLSGETLVFNNVSEMFPLMTTKRLSYKNILAELLWFISGNTNIRVLQEQGVHIWDEWADEDGDLGPIYGKQWTDWNGINQLDSLIEGLKTNPESRRHIVSSWNVSDLPDMRLPCCHILQQYVRADSGLDLIVYQRSADAFLGLPYNIASYATLLHMVAANVGMRPMRLVMMLGDVHIYKNHVNQVRLLLSREPRKLPKLHIPTMNLYDYILQDFVLTGYDPYPEIKAEVAV